jgi:hypothetical protein
VDRFWLNVVFSWEGPNVFVRRREVRSTKFSSQFQRITITLMILHSRVPQSAHLWTYSVPPSLNRLYGPSHPATWCWLSDTYCCTHARAIALAKANHARPSSGRDYGNSSLNLRYRCTQTRWRRTDRGARRNDRAGKKFTRGKGRCLPCYRW